MGHDFSEQGLIGAIKDSGARKVMQELLDSEEGKSFLNADTQEGERARELLMRHEPQLAIDMVQNGIIHVRSLNFALEQKDSPLDAIKLTRLLCWIGEDENEPNRAGREFLQEKPGFIGHLQDEATEISGANPVTVLNTLAGILDRAGMDLPRPGGKVDDVEESTGLSTTMNRSMTTT